MESSPLRIRAITKRSFELDEDILLVVLDMLEAIGLQRLPAWRLDRGSLTLSVLPPASTKQPHFTALPYGDWTSCPELLPAEPLDEASAHALVAQLLQAGFASRRVWWFAMGRTSVRLEADETQGKVVYRLEITGAKHELLLDQIDAMGVDRSRLEARKRTRRLIGQVQILATLEGARPPIWRRFIIPTAATLWSLHCTLSDLFLFDWEDICPHRFDVPLYIERDGQEFLALLPFGIPDAEGACLPSWRVTLDELLELGSPALVEPPAAFPGAPQRARQGWDYEFEFDDAFGESWQIRLQVEAIERLPRARLACLAGEGQSLPNGIEGIEQWNDIRAEAARSVGSRQRTADVSAAVLARARTVWEPSAARFSDADLRLQELKFSLDGEVPFDEPRRSAAQRVAAFVLKAPRWVCPVIKGTASVLRFWFGTVEDGRLVLLGRRKAGVIGPHEWHGPFEFSAEQMVADHPERFVVGGAPHHAIPLPARRLLDVRGSEWICFQMLIVVPSGTAQRQPTLAELVAVPVALLSWDSASPVAMREALALALQPTTDSLVVAGRALVLASFDASIRALLELRDGEGARALPVLRALLLREPR